LYISTARLDDNGRGGECRKTDLARWYFCRHSSNEAGSIFFTAQHKVRRPSWANVYHTQTSILHFQSYYPQQFHNPTTPLMQMF